MFNRKVLLMPIISRRLLPTLLLLTTFTSTASAHFVWLVPKKSDDGQSVVHVYFGEDGTDESVEHLNYVKDIALHRVVGKAEPIKLPVMVNDNGVAASIDFTDGAIVIAERDLGIFDRGDAVFRLQYYAKAGPALTDKAWRSAETADNLRLDMVPSVKNGKVRVTVFFDQQPVAGAQVVASRPGMDNFEGETNEKGVVTFKVAEAGLHSLRARHVDKTSGTLDGREYPETRHYVTAAVRIPTAGLPVGARLQNLPQPVTSFGAAIVDDALYMYGGHKGSAHSYSRSEQSNLLTKLDLNSGQWSTVAEGPHLQGLALVAHGGKLYRIGGFTAENEEGEDHKLVSQSQVQSFDPATGKWTDMPALPEPRSSHDAAVVGDCIYVVGGWAMNGDEESHWHESAWKLDLSDGDKHWQKIADPPFQRRALALAAHDEKLYVVGGMQQEGGPTTAVAVYDPATDAWSEGPSLLVQPTPESENGEKPRRSMSSGAMTGFGASAFATGGSLYVTTVQGTLQRLSEDGSEWELVADDVTPRFFHRLLPLDDAHLVALGGANMSIGKFEEVDIIRVRRKR
jgi:hypothetical protein